MKNSQLIAFAAVGLCIYIEIRRKKDPPVFYKRNLLFGYNAHTIPPLGIFIKESEANNQALLDHELVHWKQFQDRGLIRFYIDYLSELINYGYDNMPLEIQARKNESKYCKLNFTECVRTGNSNTVFNPSFRT